MDDLNGSCIYLTGMMGSGKSTVGKLVAEALDYDFVDRYFRLGKKATNVCLCIKISESMLAYFQNYLYIHSLSKLRTLIT